MHIPYLVKYAVEHQYTSSRSTPGNSQQQQELPNEKKRFVKPAWLTRKILIIIIIAACVVLLLILAITLGVIYGVERHRCASSPCQNGAMCKDTGVNVYTCTCMSGYTGSNCEAVVDSCHSSPCYNGASCSYTNNGYSCSCLRGYQDSQCGTVTDNCQSSPCRNGTCFNVIGSYNCSCKTGYGGRNCDRAAADCGELYASGMYWDGVYQITPIGWNKSVNVYCDMSNGGWTCFQRRINGTLSFNRVWSETRNGFGNASGEYWLGNEAIYALTTQGNYSMRWNVRNQNGTLYTATWNTFSIGPENDNYRLSVGGWYGNISSNFSTYHNGMQWSTQDRDNDMATQDSCARELAGPWWYNTCMTDNLNNLFWTSGTCRGSSCSTCVYIQDFYCRPVLSTTMKIRRNTLYY